MTISLSVFATAGTGNPAPPAGTTGTPASQLDGNFTSLANNMLFVLANINAIRGLTALTRYSTACYVLGYTISADGGQGVFIYVSTDTTSADNGGTIIVDVDGGRWYRA
jgi:hypothetical protein